MNRLVRVSKTAVASTVVVATACAGLVALPATAAVAADPEPPPAAEQGVILFGCVESGVSGLCVIDQFGEGRKQITTDGGMDPAWAPTGDWFVYTQGDRIIRAEYDSEAREITEREEIARGNSPSVSPDPDNPHIVYARYDDPPGDASGEWVLFSVDRNGFNREEHRDPASNWMREPDWSRDGSRILFGGLGISSHDTYDVYEFGLQAGAERLRKDLHFTPPVRGTTARLFARGRRVRLPGVLERHQRNCLSSGTLDDRDQRSRRQAAQPHRRRRRVRARPRVVAGRNSDRLRDESG